MKTRILCAGLFAVLMVAYFVACGGDDSSVKSVAVPEIESADDLDSCSKSNEGETITDFAKNVLNFLYYFSSSH